MSLFYLLREGNRSLSSSSDWPRSSLIEAISSQFSLHGGSGMYSEKYQSFKVAKNSWDCSGSLSTKKQAQRQFSYAHNLDRVS